MLYTFEFFLFQLSTILQSMPVMPIDTKKTVILIICIGSLNVQYMNFPKKMKEKGKEIKSNNLLI